MITLGIAQGSVMGLFTGGKPLFQGQTFVLLDTLLRGCGQSQLVESLGVQLGLFGELLTVAPSLDLPGQRGSTTRDCNQ
ncbi:hypothetical protein D3C80_1440190 [compost metagenome]